VSRAPCSRLRDAGLTPGDERPQRQRTSGRLAEQPDPLRPEREDAAVEVQECGVRDGLGHRNLQGRNTPSVISVSDTSGGSSVWTMNSSNTGAKERFNY
jgi:hypothetical protein